MFSYTLGYKTVIDSGTYLDQLKAEAPSIEAFSNTGTSIIIQSTQELYAGVLASLDSIIPASKSAQKQVEEIITNAIAFGNKLVVEFAAENVLLGITQAGMTGPVRAATSEVITALQTGSLYDAMAECRAIPSEAKDAIFVTDVRLLSFINKIEAYLGLSLSSEL